MADFDKKTLNDCTLTGCKADDFLVTNSTVQTSDVSTSHATLPVTAGNYGSVTRSLSSRSSDRVYLEDFGCSGTGDNLDFQFINKALEWSANKQRPVYAEQQYWIAGFPLDFISGSALIASPTARFVRKYGAPDPGGGFTLAGTKGAIDRPNIHLQGGIWGPDDPLEVSVGNVEMAFVRTDAASGTITFTATGGGANPFFSNPSVYPGDQFILVYGAEGAANNYKGFHILAKSGNTLTVEPGPLLSPGTTGNSETVTGMSAVATVPGGHVFNFFSTGGVIRDVDIVQPRGIQFFVSGSNFLLSHCKSRQKAPDGGGGVIMKRGRFIRCEQLDLECSDDVFIFSPDEGSALDPVVLEDCCVVDSVCSSSSGIVAFLTSGDAIQPEPYFGQMRNCSARNIKGRYSDDRLRYGRHGIIIT